MAAELVHEIATEALVDAIVTTGRRLGGSVLRGRRPASESAVLRWFDTYQLVDSAPDLPDLPSPSVLRSDPVQAVLHELLAARLTDAPEADVSRVRSAFVLTVGPSAEALFDYYDSEICTLVGRLADGELLRQVRSEALSARMIAVLHAIERHTASLETGPDHRTEEGWLTRYRRHVAEHHGLIDPPDFDRRRRVPISDLYVPPTIVPIVETDPDRPPPEIDLWTLDAEIDRTVLLGDPGAGKTTTANVLMHHHASGVRVPFLVTLREYAAQDPPEWSVAAFIEHKLERFYQCRAPSGCVPRLLLSGRALVVFDGLDELVDTARRAEVTAVIERFCTEYPLTRVLVTSRLVGYDQARLDDRQFTRYRIDRFTDERVAEYVRKWFALEQDIPAAEAEQFLEESATVSDLRANPLVLALMCILYRGEGSLPRNRAEVYEQCAKLLFHKWDARRRIHLDLRAGHLLEPTLRHLAHWLFTREAEPAVTERELIEETAEVLREHGFGPEAAEEFVEFCRGRMWVFSDVGTTASGQPLYAFTHRTFMEYFTAAHLAYTSDTPEKLARVLAPHVARHEWEVVGELAVQIKDQTSRQGAERLYRLLLADRRHRSVQARSGILQFLARSLRSTSPPPATVRLLAKQVLDHFLSGDLNDPIRFLPLSWLLRGQGASREVVAEIIRGRIATMINSENPATHLNGIRLALFLPQAIEVGGSPRVPPDGPVFLFWNEQASRNAQAHAPHIVAAGMSNGAILRGAYSRGILTITETLNVPIGLLSFLQQGKFHIFGVRWLTVVEQIGDLGVTDELKAIGTHLRRHPTPPFVWGATADTALELRNRSSTRVHMDPAAYLGAAACLLISMETRHWPVDLEEKAAPFAVLQPYIARRWGIESDGELPELPVPEHFQRLFRDWADDKVDFVGPAQESAGGGVV